MKLYDDRTVTHITTLFPSAHAVAAIAAGFLTALSRKRRQSISFRSSRRTTTFLRPGFKSSEKKLLVCVLVVAQCFHNRQIVCLWACFSSLRWRSRVVGTGGLIATHFVALAGAWDILLQSLHRLLGLMCLASFFRGPQTT